MWIVYNKKELPKYGWEVPTEAEAIELCKENSELTYCWFGKNERR